MYPSRFLALSQIVLKAEDVGLLRKYKIYLRSVIWIL